MDTTTAPQCGDQTCTRCGQTRDRTPHGVRRNLSADDDGYIGGQDFCGDSHEWGEPHRCGNCEACCYGQA